MPAITAAVSETSFTGTANGTAITVNENGMAWVEGTFAATMVLECQPPGAADFIQATARDLTAYSVTAPRVFMFDSVEGARWRWRCSAFTSGTAATGIVAVD